MLKFEDSNRSGGGDAGWEGFWTWWKEEEVRRPRQWLLNPQWARYTLI